MIDPSAGEQLRRRILEAATQLIVSYGYDGISMREIAEAVGISKAGLYYYFRDKEDLLLAVLTENISHLEQALIQARKLPTARDQITAFIEALFVQIATQSSLVRLGMLHMPRISERTRMAIEQSYYTHFIAPIEAIIRDGIARHELRPVEPRIVTWLLLGLIYPFFQTAHPYAIRASQDAVELIVSTFFDGVGL